ncbi:hypothetical protein GQ55_7G210600 [Panicum hallii var. hallii]|uniref:Uncharacterized protein n=1 Tax=Panicum hallii var. hallii TaxID=1504633 RepID=A0A2T7CXE4_9POAL|nr:hypothetical protein GQ55_7G210600 [Panicum hallii var. hallii]
MTWNLTPPALLLHACSASELHRNGDGYQYMFPCAPGSTHAVLGCLSGFSWNTDTVRTEGPIVIDRQQPLSCGVNATSYIPKEDRERNKCFSSGARGQSSHFPSLIGQSSICSSRAIFSFSTYILLHTRVFVAQEL